MASKIEAEMISDSLKDSQQSTESSMESARKHVRTAESDSASSRDKDTKIAVVTSHVKGLWLRVHEAERSTNAIAERLEAAESGIESTKVQVTSAESSMESLKGRVQLAENCVESTKELARSIESDLASLKEHLLPPWRREGWGAAHNPGPGDEPR